MTDDKILNTEDFDGDGFPVDEAVEFYHKKAKKLPKQKFSMLSTDDFIGHNDDLLSTKSDIMGEGILGLGDFLQSTKKSISNKKKKGKKKGTLIGDTGIFKL